MKIYEEDIYNSENEIIGVRISCYDNRGSSEIAMKIDDVIFQHIFKYVANRFKVNLGSKDFPYYIDEGYIEYKSFNSVVLIFRPEKLTKRQIDYNIEDFN